MKKIISLTFITTIIVVVSCKKHESSSTNSTPPPPTDNYASISAFFSQNAPAMQTYTVNATTGGNFTSPQGTAVTIPANAFVTQAGAPVTGVVTIQFKDIYKKSDMLLANMATMMSYSYPLKSGGEFYIKAISNNAAVTLASGQKISVSQPASLTGGLDPLMQPFVAKDTVTHPWVYSAWDSVSIFTQNYIFKLYQMNTPVDSGSWSNSDNSNYFSAYTQTTLKLVANDSAYVYDTFVFLLFKNLSSMVHVYNNYETFSYNYAPQGLQCTMVAVGIKGGKLYSSFIPITISANQTVNFSLSLTTTSTFTTQLQALN